VVTGGLGLFGSQNALAQTSGQPAVDETEQAVALDEVIVTAQRRVTAIQDTPLAINAVGGEEMAARQITDLESLSAALPNVNFGRNVGFARIAIRGIGLDTTTTGQEGRVAYHLDGVYISRPSATGGTFFDIDRVEVVRGPQGTLYGRNATAGAINVITNDPTDFVEGFVRTTVGNYNLVTAEGAVGGPIAGPFSGRVAGQFVKRDGYGRNLFLNEDQDDADTQSLRGKLRFAPAETFDVVISADYHSEDDHNYTYHYLGAGKPGVTPLGQRLGGSTADDPRDGYSDSPTMNRRTFRGLAAVANWELPWATLTSVSGFRDSRVRWSSDQDNTEVAVTVFNMVERSKQYTQELRLAGDYSRGNWLVGGYYFKEDIFGFNDFTPMTRAVVGGPNTLARGLFYGGDIEAESYAVFGQFDFDITDALTLTLGARYSDETKDVNEFTTRLDVVTAATAPPVIRATQQASVSTDSVSPRVGLQYEISPDAMVYVSYSKGFKSGGFNLGAINAAYEPEELASYELGLKADWLDGRLRTNVSAFNYQYDNLQVQKVVGAAVQVLNAASAEIRGIEAEFKALATERIEFGLDISLLDSEYMDFSTSDPARAELGLIDLSGNQLSQAPDYTVSASAQYTLPTSVGEFRFRAESRWVDRVFFSPFNVVETSQDASNKINLFVNYAHPGGQWTASAFVRNLTDEDTVASSQVSASLFAFPVLGALEPPRTFGFELGYSF
jgi:iron complex outermembrane receptor protein